MGRSLIQRSPTECGVSECNCEASIMRRPWPNMGRCTMEKYLRSDYNICDEVLHLSYCLAIINSRGI
jgi:hypothetical protein